MSAVTLVDMMHEVAGSKIRKLFGCGMRTPLICEQNIMKMWNCREVQLLKFYKDFISGWSENLKFPT